jgi:hypothetical protein
LVNFIHTGGGMERDEQHFLIGADGVDIAQIRAEVRAAWQDMLREGTVENARALEGGIALDQLPAASDDAVVVRPSAAGVGSVDVVVALLVAGMVRDVWKKILLPRLVEKFGPQVLKSKGSKNDKKSDM